MLSPFGRQYRTVRSQRTVGRAEHSRTPQNTSRFIANRDECVPVAIVRIGIGRPPVVRAEVIFRCVINESCFFPVFEILAAECEKPSAAVFPAGMDQIITRIIPVYGNEWITQSKIFCSDNFLCLHEMAQENCRQETIERMIIVFHCLTATDSCEEPLCLFFGELLTFEDSRQVVPSLAEGSDQCRNTLGSVLHSFA